MSDDCARFVALRILEQAIDDATCKTLFRRSYTRNLAEVCRRDALHFFNGAWFPIVSELAGFEPSAIVKHIKTARHKRARKTL